MSFSTLRATLFFFFPFCMALMLSWIVWPGLMSLDSIQQHRQMLGLIPMVDSHPPIMAYTWRLMAHIVEPAGGVLFFNQLLYWATVALLAVLLFVFSVLIYGSAPYNRAVR